MKLNLKLPLAEIYLMLLITLPAAIAAPPEADKLAGIDSAAARVKRTISQLGEQITLSRKLTEFVEEIGLFDNRSYGRVAEKSTLQETKVNSLNSQIEAKTDQLNSARNNLEPGAPPGKGIDGTFEGEGQEGVDMPGADYDLMVKQLEDEIDVLSRELAQILLPLEGGTELLDGSVLLNEVLPPVEMLGEHAARQALEQQRKLLERLEREREKLEKESSVSPGNSGEKRKNK